nr:cbb3-type cytochrome c oxidase subunit I [Thermicanus aegyptius]
MAKERPASHSAMKEAGTTRISFLKSVLIFTLILSFSVLLMGGYWVFKDQAPRPEKVVNQAGEIVFTKEQLIGGQAVFQKYGLMDYGTVLGDGSYLGPDYTAETLRVYTEAMQEFYARVDYKKAFTALSSTEQAAIREKVIAEIKENRYDAAKKQLVLTDAQTAGLEAVRVYYKKAFTQGDENGILPAFISEAHMPRGDRAYVASGDQIDQLSDFFFWTAWLSSTLRPGETITYTNNWPFYTEAGNQLSFGAILWSGISVTVLILMLALIMFVYYRYKLEMEEAYLPGHFPSFNLAADPLTPSQRKTGKYFAVVAALFFVQVMFGGLLAHYYLEPDSFYGLDWIVNLFPFTLAKTYHLQLAIFWIATAWLGMGIYVAPLVGGREPKYQGLLVDFLFWALVVLVGGSMVGEWLGAKGFLGNVWFLLGHQGWEYLELGRIWQIILAIGMTLWLIIVYRGLRDGLKQEKDRGGLVHLLFYSAIAVPFFYLFAFLINPGTSFTFADYWRWWIIHLWVEGIFEVFAVVVIGFLMVQMKLTTKASTIRALYFQIILLLGSGVIGIGHHYYYNGSPEVWVALGAVFSALEVIPLTLLILDAYGHYRMLRHGGVNFPYRASFWFLISTAIWNLLGAGVLGFLINLPAVNYFEHGQMLTAAHGHGSMMGVYGMFAIAVLLFSLRNVVKPEWWNDKWLKVSVWGLNLGLAGMILFTLLPVGLVQLKMAYDSGYWFSRSAAFFQDGSVRFLLWIRLIPDSAFILLGVVPLLIFTVRALFNLRKPTVKEGELLEM